MKDEDKRKLYRSFREHGFLCECSHCGKRDFCACDARDLSAECFQCALNRLERAEKFNYEDFIRL